MVFMIKMFIKKFLVICDFSKFNLGSSFSECVIFSCLWNLLGNFVIGILFLMDLELVKNVYEVGKRCLFV